MFRIGLRELERVGSVRVRHTIAADDPLWEGSDLELLSGVDVELLVSRAAAGEQVVARGEMSARLGGACRRCLAAVRHVVREPLALVWSYGDDGSETFELDGEIRTIPAGAADLDVRDAIREEMLLAAPAYLLCVDACRGICPRCGIDLNEEECRCEGQEADSRWEALRLPRNG